MIKKNMNLKKIIAGASLALGLLVIPSITQAQVVEPWTGAVAGDNIDLNRDATLKRVRSLINKGDTVNAVRIAKRFVRELTKDSRSGKTEMILYDAFNALCVSLTANKEYDDALGACNAAIEETPDRWLAYNSRGTLNYKTGKHAEALADYRMALSNTPGNTGLRRLIEHNISISEARVSGN